MHARAAQLIAHAAPLCRADMAGERYVYIMGGASAGTLGTMSANFRLPAGVSCSGGCVLQWGEWLAAAAVVCLCSCMHHPLLG
jgi:hypothetical protein